MVLTDEKSRPVFIAITSASILEVKVAEQVIAERASKQRPKRITCDKAYDSDAMDCLVNAPVKLTTCRRI